MSALDGMNSRNDARGPTGGMNAALSFRRLSVHVGEHTRLLNDVTLDFAGPGLYGVIGPNGAGKSTLIRTALGLLRPSQGGVWIDMRPLSGWKARDLAAHIGYMPQKMTSHWDLSVRELLLLHCRRIPDELLERCGLHAFLDHRFSTLSGGEQARVGLARALIHRPSLVFADEPAAHLDMPHQHHMLRLLKAYAMSRTVLVVLHDLHLASRYCDRIALLSGGALAAFGPPKAVLSPKNLARAYGAEIAQVVVDPWDFFSVQEPDEAEAL